MKAWLFLIALLAATGAQAGPSFSSPFKCNGRYGSYTCETTLFLNDCKNSIKLRWEPLKFPGTDAYKKEKRTWCSLTWNSNESVEERKLPPRRCEKILRVTAAALKTFPEIKWQDTACTHLGTPDGVVYATQQWDKPTEPVTPNGTKALKIPPGYKDPEPMAVGLNDVRGCELRSPVLKRVRKGANDQTPVDPRLASAAIQRTLRCPVLRPNVLSWLMKFSNLVNVRLVIKNKLE